MCLDPLLVEYDPVKCPPPSPPTHTHRTDINGTSRVLRTLAGRSVFESMVTLEKQATRRSQEALYALRRKEGIFIFIYSYSHVFSFTCNLIIIILLLSFNLAQGLSSWLYLVARSGHAARSGHVNFIGAPPSLRSCQSASPSLPSA